MTFSEKFAMASLMGGLGKMVGRGAGALGRGIGGMARGGMNTARAIGPRGLAIGGGLGGMGLGGMWMANAMSKKPTGPAGIFQNRNQDLESIYQSMGPSPKSSAARVLHMAQRLIR